MVGDGKETAGAMTECPLCRIALKWHQGRHTGVWVGHCLDCGHQSLSTSAPVLEPVDAKQPALAPRSQPTVSRPLATIARQVQQTMDDRRLPAGDRE